MLQASTPEFKEYIQQVKSNAKTLASTLIEKGYNVVTNGTDNHIVLWNLRAQKLTGSKMEKLLELVNISVNKNSIAGDTSALSPSGVRLGTSALTSRGLKEEDFKQIVNFLDASVKIALNIQVIIIHLKLLSFLLIFFFHKTLEYFWKSIKGFCKRFR